MRLGEFILRDLGQILQRWEAFASTRLPTAESMSSHLLRDHGPEILQAIVADLATTQTPDEQTAKSMGRGLQTIQITARHLQSLDSNGAVNSSAERLIRSGARMQKLLDDLIDFNRTELGLGIRVATREVDR